MNLHDQVETNRRKSKNVLQALTQAGLSRSLLAEMKDLLEVWMDCQDAYVLAYPHMTTEERKAANDNLSLQTLMVRDTEKVMLELAQYQNSISRYVN